VAINPLTIPGYAAPQAVDFTSLANLGNVYRKAQNERTLTDVGQGLADGSIDYRAAAGQIAGTGNIDAVYKFLQLDEEKKKQVLQQAAAADFNTKIGSYYGGSGQPATEQPARQPAATPGASIPLPGTVTPSGAVPAPLPLSGRAPVASSSKVWGDDEAVAAGLYEPAPQKPLTLASLAATPPMPGSLTERTGGPAGKPPLGSLGSLGSLGTAQPGPSPYPQAPTGSESLTPPAARSAQASPGQVPIPVLMEAISNPNLPAGQKEIAGKLLTRALDDQKPNEKIRYLQELKDSSGYKGTLLQLEMEMKRAGKTDVTTNIDQRTETEENKAAGKAAGDRRATMFSAAGAAGRTLQNLSRTESLLEQVSQGKLEPAKMSISAWAKALGVNDEVATSLGLDPKGVGSAQALQALANESVLSKIGSGGFPANNFSNSDREFLVDMFPKLGNDPRGNKIMVEGARRIAQLDMQRAREYQTFKTDPANKGKGFEDFELAFSEKVAKQDLFGDLRKQAEAIVGAPRPEVGRTLGNPGATPQGAQGGWQDLGGGVRIRERN